MSRTLAHRPWWTWFDDASVCVEDHDHRDGPCDLPALSEWHDWLSSQYAQADVMPDRWRCGWDQLVWCRPPICGCHVCTGSRFRRMDRRADRHLAKLVLRTGRWPDEYE